MTRSLRSERRTLRAALGLVLAVGLLAMCHAAWSAPTDAAVANGSVTTVVADESPAAAVVHEQASADSPAVPGGDGVAGCCALLIACIVAVVGLGALLASRARRAARVLWRVPAALRRGDGIPVLRPVRLFSLKRPAVLIC